MIVSGAKLAPRSSKQTTTTLDHIRVAFFVA
jgi:hypothetical protein